MCLAVPGEIVVLEGAIGKVDFGSGVIRDVNMSMLEVTIGDFIIVHAGFAIQKLNEEEAKETLRLFEELLAKGNDE